MKQARVFAICIFFMFACAVKPSLLPEQPIELIATGSCLRQRNPQPVWEGIQKLGPDLLLLAGDNVYADTRDPVQMRAAYQQLAADPGYQRLKATLPILATWDDHDYGEDNAGAEYPMKVVSRGLFLDFFGIAEDHPLRKREGVYRAETFGPPTQLVQVILLDTRYFRSPLVIGEPSAQCLRQTLIPNKDPAATILGDEQWRWLETQLKQPAVIRILVSSIQVIPYQHCFEKWANFPYERERLLELISSTSAHGVVLVSGDRHLGEISRLDDPRLPYPLYELTASGLNSAGAGEGETNRFRVNPDNVRSDHFGIIRIDWEQDPPSIRFELRGINGELLQWESFPLGSTNFASRTRSSAAAFGNQGAY